MTSYDDDYDETSEDSTSKQPNWRRKLEADAAAGREAAERATKLERELAFTKAGINPDDPKMSYFVKGYDGDISADAIKKAATDAGFISEPTAQNASTDAEVAALDKVSQASVGAGVAPAEDPVQGLFDADRAGGKEAVLERLRRDGLVEVY